MINCHHPTTIASCASYFAMLVLNAKNLADEEILDTISKAADTTKPTVKNMYLQLYPYRFELFTGENVDFNVVENMPEL